MQLLAEARLAQGEVAEALARAREVTGPGASSSPAAQLLARGVEIEALLTAGERDAARALLAAARAEILAIAADIEDAELRATFLARGPRVARLLRLAKAEGLAVEVEPPGAEAG